ncbi:hypothetical protein ERJ75_000031700 [Trypanosoma vivax]|uniref:Uncharacterized protein n=1 Tax=Trypanosoma vivax (strain Y486) TaxID=1055687 RepID=G0U7W7_TRYVY|nr:hypothetical protein ERJ75_001539100 [Trypanosoma vivax]KAH8606259.1 hypothetical protein ERJ75_001538300 [Trypanosoma vivax]KAH8620575.1 hypothetical protein ERJ75_000031700 [Trypanosoma vivax]CCC51975.1 conserved hypothetical protein [Trypanosoma vivax Y486]
MHQLGKRELPSFDNHYGSGVLIDSWYDTRIYEAQGGFTLAMDPPGRLPCSVYKDDYTDPGATAIQPMMRRRGLGKDLMFGTGMGAGFGGEPTSLEYGATQRQLIDARHPRRALRAHEHNDTISGNPRYGLSSHNTIPMQHPTAHEEMENRFATSKQVMDTSVEHYHFQRQMASR